MTRRQNPTLWWIVIIVVAVSLWRYSLGVVQQDNYVGYAQAFLDNRLNTLGDDTRYFPGLPLILSTGILFSIDPTLLGFVLNWLLLIGAFYLYKVLTNETLSAIWLIFPPVLLTSFTTISTEPLAITILLLSVWANRRQHYELVALLIGTGVWVRLILIFGIFLILPSLWHISLKRKLSTLSLFLLPILGLGIYNRLAFGPDQWLHQFFVNPNVGRATLVLPQIVSDITRLITLGELRVLIAFIFYLTLLIIMLYKTYHKRQALPAGEVFTIGAMLLFIFSLGPVPVVEEITRFLIPVFVLLGLHFSQVSPNAFIILSLFAVTLTVI